LRSTLTTLGIAISSGALVSMVAFVLGLQTQFEEPIQALGLLNNITVQPRSEEDDARPLDDEALESMEQIPGVAYAYPDFRLSQVAISTGDNEETGYAIGMPREATLISMFDDLLVAGEYFSLGDDAEAVIGEELASDLGFESPNSAVGRTIDIATSGLDATEGGQFELRRQELRVRISGVVRPPSFAMSFGHRSVILPVDTMRDLPGTIVERNLNRLRNQESASLTGYPLITVHTHKAADVFRVEKTIQDMGFEARAFANRIKEARRFFVFMEVLLTAVGTVGLIVAGLGIMNTLMMAVLERYQEIGIYKAIGASDGDVRVLFLTEAAALGVLGGLGGLLLARVVCWILQWGIDQYARHQGVEGPLGAFEFPLWLLVGAVLYATGISILSGLYPASRAARVDPIEALRGE
jgi:putative ABC transport system permease protein